ncbi:hypothetical protein LB577_14745 [Mesorhizobium sp. B283B1A]|uniref:hypothetical protein n=1 Tax=Mesorhizobium TaxID=68287 RepID=UPI001CD0689A|nr:MULTISPECIES: hypothetical protein [Mesorhizobium]MCA0048202.1 hypothetical protein [Mesorhizobium sp. B283B1A]UQS67443.1 hypothetical protein M5D98_14425 [Mesorhizobium opportunistum]
MLKAIASPYTGPKLEQLHYVIGVSLSLTVNDSGELAPSLSYISNAQFTFDAGFKIAKAREQNFTQNLYFSVDRLIADRKIAAAYSRKTGTKNRFEECPSPSETNLDGELGLDKVVALAFTAQYSDSNAKLNGADGEFGGYVQFEVTRNVNGFGPNWSLSHFTGPGGLIGASKVNTDRISYGFAPSSGDAEDTSDAAISARLQSLLFQLNLNQIQTSVR